LLSGEINAPYKKLSRLRLFKSQLFSTLPTLFINGALKSTRLENFYIGPETHLTLLIGDLKRERLHLVDYITRYLGNAATMAALGHFRKS